MAPVGPGHLGHAGDTHALGRLRHDFGFGVDTLGGQAVVG